MSVVDSNSNIEIKQKSSKDRTQNKISSLFKTYKVKFKNGKCKINNAVFDNTADLYHFLFKSAPFVLKKKYAKKIKKLCDKLPPKKLGLISDNTMKYMNTID